MPTTPVSTLADLRGALKADRSVWPVIARSTGVSENTLRKLAYGDRKNPQLNTIQPLYDYFNGVDVVVAGEAA